MSNIIIQAALLVLLAIIIFAGINIVLSLKFSEKNKKQILFLSLIYGIIIILLSQLGLLYREQLISFIFINYTPLFCIIAIIMIISGGLIIHNYKNKKQTDLKNIILLLTYILSLSLILISLILTSTILNISMDMLGIGIGISSVIGILSLDLVIDYIFKKREYTLPMLLGNYMIFIGLYIGSASLILPNFTSLLSKTSEPSTISSVNSVLCIFIIMVLLIILGVAIHRKNGTLFD